MLVELPVFDEVILGLRVNDGEREPVEVPLPVLFCVAVIDGVAVLLPVLFCVELSDCVDDGVTLRVGVVVEDAVTEGVGVALGTARTTLRMTLLT